MAAHSEGHAHGGGGSHINHAVCNHTHATSDHVHAAVLPLAPLPAPICDMQCFLSTDQDGFHGYVGGYLVDSAATTSV